MRKLIQRLNAWLHGGTSADARDSVRSAMKVLARRQAEADYHRFMVEYHTAEALDINPHEYWNEFALEKQAAFDHDQDYIVELRKVAAARAKLQASQERLRKLLEVG